MRAMSTLAKSCYAAGKNKYVILDVLKPRAEAIRSDGRQLNVLELASGTGEHAALFSSQICNCQYQPTEPDVTMHESIVAWTNEVETAIVLPPIALDVTTIQTESDIHSTLPGRLSPGTIDVMVCINMIHISPFHCTDRLFYMASKLLSWPTGGFLMIYGPYREHGAMVQSNMDFDASLRQRNADWGIRDLEAVVDVANQYNLYLAERIEMPSNNLCLIFKCLQ